MNFNLAAETLETGFVGYDDLIVVSVGVALKFMDKLASVDRPQNRIRRVKNHAFIRKIQSIW